MTSFTATVGCGEERTAPQSAKRRGGRHGPGAVPASPHPTWLSSGKLRIPAVAAVTERAGAAV